MLVAKQIHLLASNPINFYIEQDSDQRQGTGMGTITGMIMGKAEPAC